MRLWQLQLARWLRRCSPLPDGRPAGAPIILRGGRPERFGGGAVPSGRVHAQLVPDFLRAKCSASFPAAEFGAQDPELFPKPCRQVAPIDSHRDLKQSHESQAAESAPGTVASTQGFGSRFRVGCRGREVGNTPSLHWRPEKKERRVAPTRWRVLRRVPPPSVGDIFPRSRGSRSPLDSVHPHWPGKPETGLKSLRFVG